MNRLQRLCFCLVKIGHEHGCWFLSTLCLPKQNVVFLIEHVFVFSRGQFSPSDWPNISGTSGSSRNRRGTGLGQKMVPFGRGLDLEAPLEDVDETIGQNYSMYLYFNGSLGGWWICGFK